jgi:2-epi-5-epi-valiolone synthase
VRAVSPAAFATQCDRQSSYDVVLGKPLDDPIGLLAEAIAGRPALIVTTPTVDRQYGQALRDWIAASGVNATVEVVRLGEANKTMETVLQVATAAKRRRLGRRDPLIAFGGGICCDVVTLAATLVRRGSPYICMPTTLLAQIDAGIGLKGGVNFDGCKNFLGCFAPPSNVFIDMDWLRTLPSVEVRSGTAEIIKMALILDAELFEVVTGGWQRLLRTRYTDAEGVGRRVVARSIELMLEELQDNWYEDRSLQRLADFGHTFSARLEELSGYRLRHGLAVAVDMALSTVIASILGMLTHDECEHILAGLELVGLPTFVPWCTAGEMFPAARASARNRGGDLNLVLPTGIGRATFLHHLEDLPLTLLEQAVDRLQRRASERPCAPPRTVVAEPAPLDGITTPASVRSAA